MVCETRVSRSASCDSCLPHWVFLSEELLLPGGLWKDVVPVSKMQQIRVFCVAIFHKFPELYHVLFVLILIFKALSARLQLCCWLSAPFVLRTQFFLSLAIALCLLPNLAPTRAIVSGSTSSWKTLPESSFPVPFHSPTFLSSLVILHLTFWKPIY